MAKTGYNLGACAIKFNSDNTVSLPYYKLHEQVYEYGNEPIGCNSKLRMAINNGVRIETRAVMPKGLDYSKYRKCEFAVLNYLCDNDRLRELAFKQMHNIGLLREAVAPFPETDEHYHPKNGGERMFTLDLNNLKLFMDSPFILDIEV